MSSHRTGTCDGCGRRRKLYRNPGLPYHSFCSECRHISTEAQVVEARKNAPPKKKYRKAYPCVGGPLDGQHAATADFYSDGMYAHLSQRDGGYFEYNSAGHGRAPSMIFVWFDVGKTPRVISAAQR